jgi:hypothetical protein
MTTEIDYEAQFDLEMQALKTKVEDYLIAVKESIIEIERHMNDGFANL